MAVTPEGEALRVADPGGDRQPPAGTAYSRIAAQIRSQIVSGELRVGDRLPAETELSEHYHVSRNTAREAFRSLASEGLVTSRRGTAGGTFVAYPRPSEISSRLQTSLSLLAGAEEVPFEALVEIRELLEVPAAELAALRATEDDLAALRNCLVNPGESDVGRIFERNRAFHQGMLRAAHNPLLEVIADPVFAVLQERFARDQAPSGMWHAADQEHREILDHLERGDSIGAREAARAHLRSVGRGYQQMEH